MQPPEPPTPPPPAPPPPPAAPARPEPTPARVLLRASLDAQAVADHVARAWLSLGSVVWLGARRHVGAGLRLGASPPLSLTHPRFSGRFRELAFGPVAELRLLSTHRLAASAFLGGAAHASFLDGSLSFDGAHVEAKRFTVSVDGGAHVEVVVTGGLLVGVNAQASYFLRYQRYLVEGQSVFAPWRLSPAAGAHVALELP